MTSSKTQFRDARRIWLKQAGALASSSALQLWTPNAVAQPAVALNTLPRVALIIGNTKYAEAPLKNPANDAKAIAGELQKVGFNVNLVLDAGRAQLAGAITAFGSSLAKTKGVGLFYYAGHGAQLAWRNYLIPVDAVIEKLDDMRDKTVELNTLLQGLIAAKNPMNVIILDACRDNPFGTKVPTEAKGLSQFDAPPGSLLAYATSPGNTAGDGDGANGLYTENLLREIRMPDAKIEDVFKRVRLAVRRRSEGQQIPWESTSLEDDFYFVPPKELKKLSADEIEKQFELELGIWEKIKSSKESEPLENYLRQFPSGKFSELAQFRLDRLLSEKEKVRISTETLARQAEQERIARQAGEERQKQLRLAEDRRGAEEKRIAEERRLAEVKRISEEQRIARLEVDKRRAEETRLLATQQAAETRRLAEEKKLFEDRKAAEEKRRDEETRLSEQKTPIRRRPVAPSPPLTQNPFSMGTGIADGLFSVGDEYTYKIIDIFTGLELGQSVESVTNVTDGEVVYNDGKIVTDLLGNYIVDDTGRALTAAQYFVSEYSVGKKWPTRVIFTSRAGSAGSNREQKGRRARFTVEPDNDEIELEFRVVSREKIVVSAGTFDAFRVNGSGSVRRTGRSWQYSYWIAPQDVRRFVALEYTVRGTGRTTIRAERYELTSFRQNV